MITEERKKQLLTILQKDPANSKCFDCNAEDPPNVSFAFGCFVCNTCAQSHELLGEAITKIKSVSEEWSLEELGVISSGGNSALKEFFDYYGLMKTPCNYKYQTKAAEFYREMLTVVSKDQEFDQEFPSANEGIQMIQLKNTQNERSSITPEETKISHPLLKTQSRSPWICKCLKSGCLKIAWFGKGESEKVSKNAEKTSEKPVFKKPEGKSKELFNRIEMKLNLVISKVKNNEKIQNAGNRINDVGENLVRGVKDRYLKFQSGHSEQQFEGNNRNNIGVREKPDHQGTENYFISNGN